MYLVSFLGNPAFQSIGTCWLSTKMYAILLMEEILHQLIRRLYQFMFLLVLGFRIFVVAFFEPQKLGSFVLIAVATMGYFLKNPEFLHSKKPCGKLFQAQVAKLSPETPQKTVDGNWRFCKWPHFHQFFDWRTANGWAKMQLWWLQFISQTTLSLHGSEMVIFS